MKTRLVCRVEPAGFVSALRRRLEVDAEVHGDLAERTFELWVVGPARVGGWPVYAPWRVRLRGVLDGNGGETAMVAAPVRPLIRLVPLAVVGLFITTIVVGTIQAIVFSTATSVDLGAFLFAALAAGGIGLGQLLDSRVERWDEALLVRFLREACDTVDCTDATR